MNIVKILILIFIFNISHSWSDTTSFINKESKEIYFGTPDSLETKLVKMTTLVLTAAFQRLGYKYHVAKYPQKRLIAYMKSGRLDGDTTRVYNFNANNKHPYYIRIDESIDTIHFDAFVTDSKIKVNTWSDLEKGNLRIGYLAGVQLSEQKLKKYISKSKLQVQPVSNINGLRQLKAGRIDVFVYGGARSAEVDFKNNADLRNSKITNAGHLQIVKIYPYSKFC